MSQHAEIRGRSFGFKGGHTFEIVSIVLRGAQQEDRDTEPTEVANKCWQGRCDAGVANNPCARYL